MAEREGILPGTIFRGQFHKLIENDRANVDEDRERSKSVRERILQFNEIIRENYKPKIDEKKKL